MLDTKIFPSVFTQIHPKDIPSVQVSQMYPHQTQSPVL